MNPQVPLIERKGDTVREEREILTELLHRQAKEHQAFTRHKPGSVRRRQAKARLSRLGPAVRAAKKELRHLEAERRAEGPAAAIAWAMAQVGTTEHPMNSNWGHPVEDWILRTGYGGPVPWCGCFVHEAIVVHGHARIPRGIHLGYDVAIEQDARAKTNGLRLIPYEHAHKGCIALATFAHIMLVRGQPVGGGLPTVEGNTSPTSSGSQFNGGCVAAKVRPRSSIRAVIEVVTYPKG